MQIKVNQLHYLICKQFVFSVAIVKSNYLIGKFECEGKEVCRSVIRLDGERISRCRCEMPYIGDIEGRL